MLENALRAGDDEIGEPSTVSCKRAKTRRLKALASSGLAWRVNFNFKKIIVTGMESAGEGPRVDLQVGYGGGEGKTSGGRHPVTPWGQPTRGYKTRNNKRTDKFIVSRSK